MNAQSLKKSPNTTKHKTQKIALAGITKMGMSFLRHMQSRLQFEGDFPYTVTGVYDKVKTEHSGLKNHTIYNDVDTFLKETAADIIVDTQQGVSASYDLVWAALNAGKHVVTNNAAMVAAHGEKLSKLAQANQLHFKFSAAVLGGMPLVQNLQNGSESWYISRIHGVLNSACNYTLKRMRERHIDQKEALSAAVELGYAHTNPDIDVSGKDTLYKLALLSAVSYGEWPNLKKAKVTPLDCVSLPDVKLAEQLGYNIRHIGMATSGTMYVGPMLMEENTLIGQMDGTLTGVVVDGDQIGSIFMAGYGADEHALVASLTGDIFAISHGRPDVAIHRQAQKRKHKDRVIPRYFLRLPEGASDAVVKSGSIQSKSIDVIADALSGNQTGLIIETSMSKEDLTTWVYSHANQDESLILDIFRE